MINFLLMDPVVDQSFVVFIVGIRINSYLKIHKWMPVVSAFNRMLRELDVSADKGCMGYEYWGGRVRVCIQYWNEYEQLLAYARDKSASHFPAWFDFNSKVSRSGDVGLWHEAYFAKPGTFKAVYKNMPPFGLGRVTQLTPSKATKIEINS